MRTISMARTTPAQNPRGFSKSRLFWLSDTYSPCCKGYTFPFMDCLKVSRKYRSGQRKSKHHWELAVEGEKGGVNGNLPDSAHAIAIKNGIVTDDNEIFRLRLRNQHAIKGILVAAGQQTRTNSVISRYRH